MNQEFCSSCRKHRPSAAMAVNPNSTIKRKLCSFCLDRFNSKPINDQRKLKVRTATKVLKTDPDKYARGVTMGTDSHTEN